jgi:arylsulfatase A
MIQSSRFTVVLYLSVLLWTPQLLLCGPSGSAEAENANKPNIIFILADDQGWNGTSVQMHPDLPNSKSDFYRTPNIEKLARDGMRFSHAYSPGPMCSPTRASLQTGKSPAQLHMTNVGGRRPASPSQKLILPPHSSTLPTEEVTIGETLQEAGYATAWFGKWHLGGDGPGAHGYDESDGPTGNADGNTDDPKNPKDVFGITDRGIAFMEKNVKAGKPFYLQLWHYAVHGPVQTREETEQTYAARSPGQTHQSTTFAGMTEDLDTGVGIILDKVKDLAIDDNTYIIYMSDHGAGRNLSSNAPLNRGKGTLWEGGLRVPLIVRGPGVKAGVFCNVPTVGWDMFPTFCDLAVVEQPLPKGLEGVSLQPLFETGQGEVGRPGNQIAFHFPHYGAGPPQSTITFAGFKLIKLYETNELHLFDLNNDIGEQTDLSKDKPDKTALLQRRLHEYLASVNAGLPSLNPDFDPTAVAQAGGPGGRRGPGRGRGGPRREQIEQRQKELAALEEALEKNDLEKVGQLIAEMKKAMENAPPRSGRPRPQGAGGVSPRQQRENELKQLQQAQQESDVKKLRELISESKQRMQNPPARPGRGPGGRGPGQRRPGQEENGDEVDRGQGAVPN